MQSMYMTGNASSSIDDTLRSRKISQRERESGRERRLYSRNLCFCELEDGAMPLPPPTTPTVLVIRSCNPHADSPAHPWRRGSSASQTCSCPRVPV